MKIQATMTIDIGSQKQHKSNPTRATLIIYRLAIILIIVAMNPSSAFAQASLKSNGDRPANIGLLTPDGNSNFGAVEFEGDVVFGADGILSGNKGFLRLMTLDTLGKTDKQLKWFKITSSELVDGRAIVTTEDNKVYTIYGLQPDYLGRIALGRVLTKDATDSGVKNAGGSAASAVQIRPPSAMFSQSAMLLLFIGLAVLVALVILLVNKSKSTSKASETRGTATLRPVVQRQKPIPILAQLALGILVFLGISFFCLSGAIIFKGLDGSALSGVVMGSLLLAIPIWVWVARKKRRKELEIAFGPAPDDIEAKFLCPKCGKTDIRRPLQGWRGVVFSMIVFFVGGGIIQGLMPENEIKSFEMETIKNTLSTMIFIASVWIFFSSFFGRNRCKACKHRWK